MKYEGLSREELVAALRHCIKTLTYEDCRKCPVHDDNDENGDCSISIMEQAADMLELSSPRYTRRKKEDV